MKLLSSVLFTDDTENSLFPIFFIPSLNGVFFVVVKILLRNRATDLEARMDDGTTPLILAARHDLPDLVRHLIKAGVKVNSADNQGACV